MMGEDKEKYGSNPFAPAGLNSGGAMSAEIPQIQAAQAAAMAAPEESVKDKAIGLAMDKGMNYGVDKGAGMLSKAISGIGAPAAAGTAGSGALGAPGAGSAVTGAAGAAGKGGAAAAGGAGMAGMAAAAAPILPFVIGAMALKSIFKK